MDPDAILAEMRELAAKARGGSPHANRTLRWKFEELDEWLSKGGFLPKEWRKNRSLSPMTLTDENGLTYTRQ